MLLRRWLPAAALAALLALSLGACTPGDTVRTPGRTAVATPLFSSDDEALKVATDAYAAYLKVTDEVMQDGGRNADRFETVAIGEALSQAMESAKEFRSSGVRSTGRSAFDSIRLQSPVRTDSRKVDVYLCDDTSHVDVLDATGKSIVASDRRTRIPFAVTVIPRAAGGFVVSERDHWTGASYC
ncbi:hypothetical protein [Humibacter ginsenosidimutans]|uniref:Lipoprotein n=1 Tax=Humibacter ginsenosidimutans TaxID=2599293 RepID=A0A5B8M1T6_9MICO|nr:hypothetical protein [Humibacter ginsenosidimutans]QDZ14313.1 hypothetical protein FPZ11_05610 [Humibacter ginsenosidimutans]